MLPLCLSVCPSQAGIVPKRLKEGTQKSRTPTDYGKDLGEIPIGQPQRERHKQLG